jgi:signal peptidase I
MYLMRTQLRNLVPLGDCSEPWWQRTFLRDSRESTSGRGAAATKYSVLTLESMGMATVAAPIAGRRRTPRWVIALLIVVALLAIAGMAGTFALVRYTTTPRFRFNGASMAPCFTDQAMITASALDDGGRQTLRRGDIVVFDFPFRTDKSHIKRIIAVGGDQIAIRDGQVFLNGAVLDEPHIEQPPIYRYPQPDGGVPYTVPTGTIFVLGDNRNNSHDSHSFGAVALNSVTHKVTSACAGQPNQP